MISLGLICAFLIRLVLVLLFLPFSALDKILNFRGAVGQAAEISKPLAPLLIICGLFVEIVMTLGVVTSIADRFSAFILAGYCGVTALLWKQFWAQGDFWEGGKGRDLFWDFLKNFALAAGFLLITFGTGPADLAGFLNHPFASTHVYGSIEGTR
jgi:putative oxidoreductase